MCSSSASAFADGPYRLLRTTTSIPARSETSCLSHPPSYNPSPEPAPVFPPSWTPSSRSFCLGLAGVELRTPGPGPAQPPRSNPSSSKAYLTSRRKCVMPSRRRNSGGSGSHSKSAFHRCRRLRLRPPGRPTRAAPAAPQRQRRRRKRERDRKGAPSYLLLARLRLLRCSDSHLGCPFRVWPRPPLCPRWRQLPCASARSLLAVWAGGGTSAGARSIRLAQCSSQSPSPRCRRSPRRDLAPRPPPPRATAPDTHGPPIAMRGIAEAVPPHHRSADRTHSPSRERATTPGTRRSSPSMLTHRVHARMRMKRRRPRRARPLPARRPPSRSLSPRARRARTSGSRAGRRRRVSPSCRSSSPIPTATLCTPATRLTGRTAVRTLTMRTERRRAARGAGGTRWRNRWRGNTTRRCSLRRLGSRRWTRFGCVRMVSSGSAGPA
ncbi:hypothetical protein C8R47DRAFT_560780 [Mycena vitilis]|nr:hypothetical protein C8R47DRAFT_560780 [Mycena vitilis]